MATFITTKSWCLFLLSCCISNARQGFGPTEQEWGYVTVRNGAHLFWWLHHTSANVTHYTERPLVIWLQGGPGSSSTGYGNFVELGPLDLDLNPNPHTWLRNFNVLFVDNPVGTGFSYVDQLFQWTTTNQQIADDFVVFLQNFYETLPELKSTPLYIFSESYGGKMTAQIALAIDTTIKAGKLDIKLLGIGLGDSWISPIDSVLTWAPYLLAVGAVDQNGYEQIQRKAEDTQAAVDAGDWTGATILWSITQDVIMSVTEKIDFYNILTKISANGLAAPRQLRRPAVSDTIRRIASIMNNEVREALRLNVAHGAQSGYVRSSLWNDFMKPVTEVVEQLLNTTEIRIAVYNGQLDLIVDTPGTVDWVDRLRFPGSNIWKTAPRSALIADNFVEGYVKKVGNLAMYWINRAGHMVPADNTAAMDYILDDIQKSW